MLTHTPGFQATGTLALYSSSSPSFSESCYKHSTLRVRNTFYIRKANERTTPTRRGKFEPKHRISHKIKQKFNLAVTSFPLSSETQHKNEHERFLPGNGIATRSLNKTCPLPFFRVLFKASATELFFFPVTEPS